jgi:hypothetical protein
MQLHPRANEKPAGLIFVVGVLQMLRRRRDQEDGGLHCEC